VDGRKIVWAACFFSTVRQRLLPKFLAFRKFLFALIFDGDRWRSIELPVDAFRRPSARAGKVNMPEDNKPESNPTTMAGPTRSAETARALIRKT
jgi:hypothetical protein